MKRRIKILFYTLFYQFISIVRKRPKHGYYLFLDDERIPDEVFRYAGNLMYLKYRWIIVRSHRKFVKTIIKKGVPQFISFDHDLSDVKSEREMTGYDCAKWLSAYCMNNKKQISKYAIHTSNTVGAQNIETYLQNHIKHTGL